MTTILIPIGDPKTRVEFYRREVHGDVHGPFFVHDDEEGFDGDVILTHIATGFAVQKGIPGRRRAAWLARKLQELEVSWDFIDPAAAKEFPQPILDAIKVLRVEAVAGDLMGEAA